jgi:AcrR family transcriptional regulator
MGRPREFDRDEALQVAIKVFREKGFGATSVDDLRLSMGIGRQSFYDTFKGKKDVYLEGLRKYNTDRVLGYVELARRAASPLEAIESILVAIARDNRAERSLACLGVSSICEFGMDDAEVAAINEGSSSLLQSLFERLVKEGQKAEMIRASLDPKVTARYLQSTLTGMKVSARGGASESDLCAIAALAVDGLKRS